MPITLEIEESERHADWLDAASQFEEDQKNAHILELRRKALPEQDGTVTCCAACGEDLGLRAQLGKRLCLFCQEALEKGAFY